MAVLPDQQPGKAEKGIHVALTVRSGAHFCQRS